MAAGVEVATFVWVVAAATVPAIVTLLSSLVAVTKNFFTHLLRKCSTAIFFSATVVPSLRTEFGVPISLQNFSKALLVLIFSSFTIFIVYSQGAIKEEKAIMIDDNDQVSCNADFTLLLCRTSFSEYRVEQ